MSTRAVRDGDEWIVTGQKVWTSGAHYADLGLLLARSDPDVSKHAGITALIVDMRAPGVDVRPLRQIDGAIHFNEVFLDEVRVPVSNTLGPAGSGWGVAMTMLTNERASIGGGAMYSIESVIALARLMERTAEPVIRQRIAGLYTRYQLLAYLGYRVRTAVSHGTPVGPESSIVKLLVSELYESGGDLIVELEGPAGMLEQARCTRRRPLPGLLHVAVGTAHRRRDRPGATQHHRRPRAGSAGRGPTRQERHVPGPAAFLSDGNRSASRRGWPVA